MLYSFGAYCFDPACYALTHLGRPVSLRPQGCELLAYLLTHRDRVVSKEELLAQVWPGQYVGDAVLHTCILAVRTALHDTGRTPSLLHTVRGRGYRFVASVEVRDLLALDDPPQVKRSLRDEVPIPAYPSPSPLAVSDAPRPRTDGEYKSVSALCCLVVDMPGLVTQLGLEGFYTVLQTVVRLAHEVIQRYDGTLIPPTSEGFTVIFGAPVAQEDHARRAVLTALELRQRVHDSPVLGAHLAGDVLALGMGLHSGLVVVNSPGQDPQQLAAMVGAPLHVAMRLQQQAPPGTILLSAATYALVHTEVRATPWGTLTGDGSFPPMPLYAVQGRLGRHAGVAGRGPRVERPFVGRERELALLHDHLTTAMGGQGQVIGLVGEPGIGKTRLLTEFCRRVSGNQVTVYEGRCLSYGQATPYLPVRDLVRQMCALVEGDTAAVHTAAVQHRLHACEITAADDVALVLQLLDLPVAPEHLAGRSPEAQRARTFALLRHLVLHTAPQQPLVLVMENLHWSDPTSDAWLASLVERVAGAAVLVLGTYRPGYQPAWAAHAAVTQVAVPPLHTQDSRTVVQAVLGQVALPEARLRAIVAQAGGNPFFLEELTWYAVEQDGVDTQDAVPETVHAVLAARMDRLSSEAKRLLQMAAVIGPEVPVLLLQALADASEETVHRGLAHLQAAAFLDETRLLPEHTYTFTHALTQEVAYSSLLHARRRTLHARLVEVIEGLAGERLAEPVERLAHHALRGERWEQALAYGRQAGDKALARSAHREAVMAFEQALRALPHVPETRETRAQAIDLRLALRSALLPSGDADRILAYLREAESLAVALDDPRRLGRAAGFLSTHFRERGAYDQAVATAQRSLALATASGEVVLQALAHQRLGLAYQAQGEYRRAIDAFGHTVASFDGAWRHEHFGQVFLPAVFSRAWLAAGHAELGTFTEGRILGDAGLRIAEAVAHPPSLLEVSWGVGLLALRQGDLPRALPRLEGAVSLCHEADFPGFFPRIAAALGAAYTLAGRVADAMALLTRALEQAMAASHQMLCRLALGEAHRLAGRLDEAQALAEGALALTRMHPGRGNEAYALYLLGDIAAHRAPPDVDAATPHYRQALALAEELGMRPLQAHCHHGLGTLYATTGQREPARAALATAIALYHAMDMTFWLPQAEAALAQVAGP